MQALRFLCKLKRWIPLLWHDRDWDYVFLLEMLRLKLSGMYKAFSPPDSVSASADKDARTIRKAILLLDRIIDEKPYMDWHERHERGWGAGELVPVREGWFRWDRPHLSEAENAQEREESKRVLEHIRYLEEQDWDMLWTTLRKHMRGWWD